MEDEELEDKEEDASEADPAPPAANVAMADALAEFEVAQTEEAAEQRATLVSIKSGVEVEASTSSLASWLHVRDDSDFRRNRPAAPIQSRPPAPAGCYPSPPAPPPQHPQGGGGRRNRHGGGRHRLQQQQAQDAAGALHYQQALPAGHPAFISAPFQPIGAGYGALLASPPLGSYGPPVLAPPYGGLPLPPVPVPRDPTLLAAQHSVPSSSSSVGGGDWYMDSGSYGFGPFSAGPCASFMERCAAAAPGAPPARRPLPPPPGFVTPSPEVESERAPGSPSPSYEVEPGTPPAHPATGSTSPSLVASSAAGSADAAAAAAPAAAAAAAAAAPPAAPGAPAAAALLPRHLA
nr:vegetative cell wall protein gp1-like [Aegilops tauschii subsp. strangulata]